MRLNWPISLALNTALLIVVGFASPAHADWEVVRQTFDPKQMHDPGKDCVGLLGVLGDADATVGAGTSVVVGLGYAWDVSLGCAPQAAAVATGIREESWIHKGEGYGVVLLAALVDIQGSVDLLDADCSAAALGRTEFTYRFDDGQPTTIDAQLEHSVAQTSSGQLGALTSGGTGPGYSVNLQIGLGTGTYPDDDRDRTIARDCPSGGYYQKHRTHGYVLGWANAGILDLSAGCTAVMVGTVQPDVVLATVTQCN